MSETVPSPEEFQATRSKRGGCCKASLWPPEITEAVIKAMDNGVTWRSLSDWLRAFHPDYYLSIKSLQLHIDFHLAP